MGSEGVIKTSLGVLKHQNSFLLLKFYLFLAALAVHCYAQAFSSCSEQELCFPTVQGLLTAVASLVAERGL